MGLDIGIMRVTYLDRPSGSSYKFAWEMAVEASVNGYMHGEGNNWGAFTQRQVLELLENFDETEDLSDSEKQKIHDWLKSLPWDGWQDGFDPEETDEDGGLIELHFNW